MGMDDRDFPHLRCLSLPAPMPRMRMTDRELSMELKRLECLFDQARSAEEGRGGSPGEWIWERMQELETEKKRRGQAKKRRPT
jgi:hypothetical protein